MPTRKDRQPDRRASSLLSRRQLIERSALALGGVVLAGAGIRVAEAQVAGVNFFIGPNGNDSNPGTLASPWAITSLLYPANKNATAAGKANWAKIAGQSVGLLPGQYNIGGYCDTTTTYAGITGIINLGPILAIPAGTAASNTTICSVNSSGVYSPLSATIDAGNATGVAPYYYAPAIGANQYTSYPVYTTFNTGYITIAGLALQNCVGSAIDFTFDPTISAAHNLVIRDNSVQLITTKVAGNNPGCIRGATILNSLVTNNLLFNYLTNSAEQAAGDIIHMGAVLVLFGNGVTYSYNTIYNSITCCGIHLKGASAPNSGNNYDNRNSTIAYNFIQIPYAGSLGVVDFASTDPTSVNYLNNNIINADVYISHGSVYTADASLSDSNIVYNNTFYSSLSSNGNGGVRLLTTLAKGITSFNNIIYAPNVGSNFGYLGVYEISNTTLALSDFNCFPAAAQTAKALSYGNSSNWGSPPGSNVCTLPAWQTALGADPHSIAANPGFSPQSLNPLSYQLPANSPCAAAGRIGGVASAAATDIGAWGNNALRIGYTAGTPPSPPTQFSVS